VFALILGGAIAGLLGAILALPITAAGRDIYRYLFRRLSPPRADGGTTPATDPPTPTGMAIATEDTATSATEPRSTGQRPIAPGTEAADG